MSPTRENLIVRLARSYASDLDNERFVATVRNTVIVAFVLVVSSEIAAAISPAFPKDIAGTQANSLNGSFQCCMRGQDQNRHAWDLSVYLNQ